MNCVERILELAEEQPDHEAIIASGDPEQTRTYADLARGIHERAKRFRDEGGLAPGDRCGLVAQQGPDFVEAALAIMWAGGCVAPIPDDLAGPALDDFAQKAFLHHLVLERESFTCRPADANTDLPSAPPDPAFRALDPAYLRFTSGTTSERKGVVISHASAIARTEAAQRVLQVTPADRILWLLPMAHHFVVSILLYLRAGATILLPSSSLARDVLTLSERHAATFLYASPYHYGLLAKDNSDANLGGVRLAISTAEGLRSETAERFRDRFGFPLVQALGIIEVGLPVLNRQSAGTKPDALGHPLPDYNVSLIDDDGRALHSGTSPERTGEICIRGPGLFDAYLSPWTPAREVVEPHGFRTGDQGWIDEDGDLRIAGRRANRINMAGMKFFGEEVEAVLDQHPEIIASRVSGQEHPALGEIPIADIVPRDPANAPERKALLPFCKEHLPAYKIPRTFRVVETLPQTATGKVQRTKPSDRSA